MGQNANPRFIFMAAASRSAAGFARKPAGERAPTVDANAMPCFSLSASEAMPWPPTEPKNAPLSPTACWNRSRASGEATAVKPEIYRHGFPRGLDRRPNREVQAVLAHFLPAWIDVAEYLALYAVRPEFIGFAHAAPGLYRLRCLPTRAPHRSGCERH